MESQPLYTDNANPVAAREYVGCFTVNQVRQLLGQTWVTDTPNSIDLARDGGKEVTRENHYLPNCICAKIHVQCRLPGIEPEDEGKELATLNEELAALNKEHAEIAEKAEAENISFRMVQAMAKYEQGKNLEIKLDQLREAADSGCWFCSVLYGGINEKPLWDPSMNPPDTSKLILKKEEFGLSVFVSREPLLMFYIDKDKESFSPCDAFHVRQEPIYADPLKQIEFASSVFKNCVENHKVCTPTSISNSFMPTRLIHIEVVGGKYTMRLVERIPREEYVAFSHCWGPSFPAHTKTTTSNVNSRLSSSGILWRELPQTFCDAIAVSERLGFQYLWIDALCIIQDSVSDWQAEAALMCDVYSSSSIVLSADASCDANVGLFRSANMSTRPWPAMTTPQSHWDPIAVQARFSVIHYTYGKLKNMYKPFDQFHIYPLSTRAWCYQEGRLARRVLHFSVDELSYDCADGVECQCGYFGPKGQQFNIHSWYKNLPEGECTESAKLTQWFNTVTNYSERDISFWTDRLPALSGLAKQFQVRGVARSGSSEVTSATIRQLTDRKLPFRSIDLGTYLAGIWSNDIAKGLAWQAELETGRQISTASRYVAPTWSWASISTAVSFRDYDDLEAEIWGNHKYWYSGRLEYQAPDSQEFSSLGRCSLDYIRHGAEPKGDEVLLKDDRYFALLYGSGFLIVIKAVQGSESNVYERVGSVFLDCHPAVTVYRPLFLNLTAQVIKLI